MKIPQLHELLTQQHAVGAGQCHTASNVAWHAGVAMWKTATRTQDDGCHWRVSSEWKKALPSDDNNTHASTHPHRKKDRNDEEHTVVLHTATWNTRHPRRRTQAPPAHMVECYARVYTWEPGGGGARRPRLGGADGMGRAPPTNAPPVAAAEGGGREDAAAYALYGAAAG